MQKNACYRELLEAENALRKELRVINKLFLHESESFADNFVESDDSELKLIEDQIKRLEEKLS